MLAAPAGRRRTEWEYRRQRKVAKTMKRLTWAIFAFTLLVAVFTVLLYVHPLT
jgi:lipopolysaccharide/colanic/teichoic acid biosynthesis glycosyltransferase